jgi:endonuclease/exonuclease/phosphatase family metal-dependent hydrolase
MLTYFILLTIFNAALITAANLPIRLITFNIRDDGLQPKANEKPWRTRAPRVISQLRYNTLYNPASLICLQEVKQNQLDDIMESLNANTAPSDSWAYIGVTSTNRSDSLSYNPILYRPGAWELEKNETFWLSEQPDQVGVGWDAKLPRILNLGIFTHSDTNKTIVGGCTHFDHVGKTARAESAKLILKTLDQKREDTGASFLWIGGDLNSLPTDPPYETFNATSAAVTDLSSAASWKWGEEHTATGFNDDADGDVVIDYLFAGPKDERIENGDGKKAEEVEGKWEAKAYGVLPNVGEDGIYLSDHRAVVGDVVVF